MPPTNIKDLLLAPRLDPQQAAVLLAPYGFKDPARADANLQALADEPADRQLLAEILEELLSCVAQSADPDQALNHLERFARAAVNKTHLFSYLKDSPRTLEILARGFGGSQYLAEILIRDPVYLYWVSDPQILYQQRTKREISREILRALRGIAAEEKQLAFLRSVKRREMLQIGMRDLLRLCPVAETLKALTALAEVLISAALRICRGKRAGGFSIIGMGKLGGGELNFSSDVDLIYLSDSRPETESEYFRSLARKITLALSEITNEGYIYRVDLRLRPEGRLGDIVCSLDGFRRYYYSRGETWERLALLKAWPVAGDIRLGRKFLELVTPFIYDQSFDQAALNHVRVMKKKIERKMAASHERGRNVKLGFGGIREIELIVQALQVSFGSRRPELRERNTMRALAALRNDSLISEEESSALSEAYVFLRDVENKLQMINDAQTHAIPAASGELNAFARMMGYFGDEQMTAGERFLGDYRLQTQRVNKIFAGIFDAVDHQRFV